MDLDDKAVICSCAKFVKLKIGTPIPKIKEGELKSGLIYVLQKETCVNKEVYETGKIREDSPNQDYSIDKCVLD
jgi:hypothetical protein